MPEDVRMSTQVEMPEKTVISEEENDNLMDPFDHKMK